MPDDNLLQNASSRDIQLGEVRTTIINSRYASPNASLQGEEPILPYRFDENARLDQASPGWIDDTSDMTWLSLAPFIDIQKITSQE